MNNALMWLAKRAFLPYFVTWLFVFPITVASREESRGKSIADAFLDTGATSVATLLIALGIYASLMAAYSQVGWFPSKVSARFNRKAQWFLVSVLSGLATGALACYALGTFSWELGNEYASRGPNLHEIYTSGFNGLWSSQICSVLAGLVMAIKQQDERFERA
jgi:phosphotransferase system  glucose/maltose/N-acetylglucosamine-specific IIC component